MRNRRTNKLSDLRLPVYTNKHPFQIFFARSTGHSSRDGGRGGGDMPSRINDKPPQQMKTSSTQRAALADAYWHTLKPKRGGTGLASTQQENGRSLQQAKLTESLTSYKKIGALDSATHSQAMVAKLPPMQQNIRFQHGVAYASRTEALWIYLARPNLLSK